MTPHRAHSFLNAVKGAASVQTDSALATTAGAATIVWGIVSGDNIVLLYVLFGFMLLDLIAGLGRVFLDPLEDYSSAALLHGVVKKLMRVMYIIAAGGIDFLGSFVPAFGPLMEAGTPTTKLVLGMMIVGEIASMIRNVQAQAGGQPIFEFIMRSLDRANLGGKEPPIRRHYDAPAIGVDPAELRAVSEPAPPKGENDAG